MDKKNLTRTVLPLVISLILSSCASLGHMDELQEISQTQNYYAQNTSEFLPSLDDIPAEAFTAQDTQNWWQNLQDPFLDYLIYQAFTHSYEVQSAIRSLDQADAILRASKASLLPSISINSQFSDREGQTDNLVAGLNGTWDLDLFGQTRQTVLQAKSNLKTREETLKDVQRLMIAQTAQTYIAYRTAQARVKLSEGNLDRLRTNRARINRLVESGFSTRLDLKRAETQISELQSNLAALKAQKIGLANGLALLTQSQPKSLRDHLETSDSALNLPQNIEAPRLDYVIKHRPDIRSAEWALIASTHGKRAAQLALYPDITLNGDIFSLGRLSDVGSFDAISTSLLVNIAQPLLGRGQLLAGVDLENVRVKQALLNYENSVMEAVLDIDTALMNWNGTRERLRHDQQSLETAKEAQQLAQKLFFAGEENFTSLIVAENTRLIAEENHILSRQAHLEQYIIYSAATVPTW